MILNYAFQNIIIKNEIKNEIKNQIIQKNNNTKMKKGYSLTLFLCKNYATNQKID